MLPFLLPLVSMSSFQQRAASIKDLSDCLYIGMNPIVRLSHRSLWQSYSTNNEDAYWHQEGLDYQRDMGLDHLDTRPKVQSEDTSMEMVVGTDGIATEIYSFATETDNFAIRSSWATAQYLPVWQTSPVTNRAIVNQDLMGLQGTTEAIDNAAVVFSRMEYAKPGYANDTENRRTSEFAWLLSMANQEETMYQGDIFSSVYFPLYNHFEEERQVAGIMRTVIQWGRYFANVLPASDVGVLLVLENGCDEPYSYQIQGEQVYPLGHGDYSSNTFHDYEMTASMAGTTKLNDGTKYGMGIYHGACPYSIRVYPSQEFYDAYITQMPITITASVAAIFVISALMFILYDRLVEWRQILIVKQATQTHEIVASLFPKNVRDRMLQDQNARDYHNSQLRGQTGPPIADLFPNATVVFADLGASLGAPRALLL